MSVTDKPLPNSGSQEAKERGCTCAVYAVLDSGTLYSYNADCPLHGEQWDDEEYKRRRDETK